MKALDVSNSLDSYISGSFSSFFHTKFSVRHLGVAIFNPSVTAAINVDGSRYSFYTSVQIYKIILTTIELSYRAARLFYYLKTKHEDVAH